MAKYKGHDRVVFLDGYAQGWADGLVVGEGRDVSAMVARLPALRYTDAPGVAYRPGGRAPGLPDHAVDGVPVRIDEPGHKTVTGTALRLVEMEADKRKYHMRQPSPAELAILGPRKPCDGESFCPVAPGCHICGLTREELKILKDRA